MKILSLLYYFNLHRNGFVLLYWCFLCSLFLVKEWYQFASLFFFSNYREIQRNRYIGSLCSLFLLSSFRFLRSSLSCFLRLFVIFSSLFVIFFFVSVILSLFFFLLFFFVPRSLFSSTVLFFLLVFFFRYLY